MKLKDAKLKYNFIFQSTTIVGYATDLSLVGSKLHCYIKFLAGTSDNFASTQCYSATYKPHTISIEVTDTLCEGKILSDAINIFVIPWTKDFLTSEDAERLIRPLHKLDDKHSNVVLLADYSHETMVPGSVGTKLLENSLSWLEPERYILMCMGMGFENMHSPIQYKSMCSSWNYNSSVFIEILTREENIKERSISSWKGKTGDFRYLVPNRVARQHRLDFMVQMHQRNLLEETVWSMVYPEYHDCNSQSEYFRLFGVAPRWMPAPWDKWSMSKHEHSKGPDQSMPDTLADAALIYIANDTFMDYTFSDGTVTNYPEDFTKPVVVHDISEKIIKPLLYGLPMFFNNRPGAVDQLRKLGFWLPGDSYNNEPDVATRMSKLLDAAENFEDVISTETVDYLNHNKQLLLDKRLHYRLSDEMFEAINLAAG